MNSEHIENEHVYHDIDYSPRWNPKTNIRFRPDIGCYKYPLNYDTTDEYRFPDLKSYEYEYEQIDSVENSKTHNRRKIQNCVENKDEKDDVKKCDDKNSEHHVMDCVENYQCDDDYDDDDDDDDDHK